MLRNRDVATSKTGEPFASWTALFRDAVQAHSLATAPKPAVTQAELGKLIGYSGSTVSAIERGMLRPDEKSVETREPRATSSRRPARDVAPPRGVPAGEAHKVGLVAAVGASGGRRCGGTCGCRPLMPASSLRRRMI
jgi:hypothetical protein